jgi:hypothetical protein
MPGGAARVIPIRGAQKNALEKKWTNKMNKTTHPKARDRYGRYADTIRNDGRPSPDQSENDLRSLFHGHSPLFYKPGRVIQILNYNIGSPHALIRLLAGKARMYRGKRMPLVILDLRGQEKGIGNLPGVIGQLAGRSGFPAGRLKLVTW